LLTHTLRCTCGRVCGHQAERCCCMTATRPHTHTRADGVLTHSGRSYAAPDLGATVFNCHLHRLPARAPTRMLSAIM
jgi:hypothetical protein